MKRLDATCITCCGSFYDKRYKDDGWFGGGSYYHYSFFLCAVVSAVIVDVRIIKLDF